MLILDHVDCCNKGDHSPFVPERPLRRARKVCSVEIVLRNLLTAIPQPIRLFILADAVRYFDLVDRRRHLDVSGEVQATIIADRFILTPRGPTIR